MSKSSCISHSSRQELVIIREDYFKVCAGDHCEAALLNVFEYWTNIKLGQQEQAAIENEIASAGGVAESDSDLWIFKSIPDLKAEMMGLFGETKISKALKSLQERGFLSSRNNPKYGWDRTMQYLFNIEVVQAAISRLGSRKSATSKAAKTTDGSRKNKAAIPETTSETTSKSTSEDSRKSATVSASKEKDTAAAIYIKAWLDGQKTTPVRNQYGNKTVRACAAAIAAAGYTPEQLTRYVKHLSLQPYWQDKLVSFTYIADNMAAYIATLPPRIIPEKPLEIVPKPPEDDQPATPEQIEQAKRLWAEMLKNTNANTKAKGA